MATKPGWYPHPTDPKVEMWWNGTNWSQSRLKSHGSASAAATPPTPAQAPVAGLPPMAPTPVKKKGLGCLGCFGIIVGVAIVLTVIFSIVGAMNANRPPSEDDVRASAQLNCEDIVKNSLKSPSTANFSNEEVTGTSGQYTVTGDVDSQNSFGATLRDHFVCDVTGTSSQDATLRSLG